MPQSSARNHRNNPYILDRAFVQVRHSAAGVIWRFRTEVMVLVTGTAGIWELAKAVTTAWLMVILIMTGAAALSGHRAPRHPRCAPRHPLWCRPDVSEVEEGVMTRDDPLLARYADLRKRQPAA